MYYQIIIPVALYSLVMKVLMPGQRMVTMFDVYVSYVGHESPTLVT